MSMVPPRRHGGLFVLLARRVSDRAPLVSRGVRHVRQILNPLRDIRHALNRRDVHAERPSRPEKVRTIIRRQEVMRPRGERQFARRHVRHDLVVRHPHQPRIPRVRTTHPLVPRRPAHPRPNRRVLDAGDFAGCCGVAVVLPCGLTDGSAPPLLTPRLPEIRCPASSDAEDHLPARREPCIRRGVAAPDPGCSATPLLRPTRTPSNCSSCRIPPSPRPRTSRSSTFPLTPAR